MGYVDIRERRDESALARRDPAVFHEAVERNPYPLLVTATALGIVVLLAPLQAAGPGFVDQPPFLLEAFAAFVAAVLSAYLTLHGLKRLIARRPEGRRPTIGAEKQLLLAIRDSGTLTAVEAALATSLSVDEAEEILTRLTTRGHLLIEGRDGALSYSLPGRKDQG